MALDLPLDRKSSPNISHSTCKTFGLDESFKRAINLLGLNSSPENDSIHCKLNWQDGTSLEQTFPNRFKPNLMGFDEVGPSRKPSSQGQHMANLSSFS